MTPEERAEQIVSQYEFTESRATYVEPLTAEIAEAIRAAEHDADRKARVGQWHRDKMVLGNSGERGQYADAIRVLEETPPFPEAAEDGDD